MSIDTSQSQLTASSSPIKDCLGSKNAQVVLYKVNQPVVSSAIYNEGVLSVSELILLNGNHWRKILTIFAKLMSVGDDWRAYRDHSLLHDRELICFSANLLESASFHLIAGKASWERLGQDMSGFQALDAEQRLWVKGNVMCTPYFDYRQFPNVLIDTARMYIITQLDGNKA